MATYAAPGLYVEPPAPAGQAIDPLRTDVAAFVGIAQRGPVDVATWVSSWQQLTALFGGLQANAYLGYAVKAFFDNGGELCAVVRVAAPETSTTSDGTPTSASQTAVQSVAGFAPGALATIEQLIEVTATGAQPADRTRTIVTDAAPFAPGDRVTVTSAGVSVFAIVAGADPVAGLVVWRQPLPASIDITQPLVLEMNLVLERIVQAVDPVARTLQWAPPLDSRVRLGAAAPGLAIATGAAPAQTQLIVEPGPPLLELSARTPGTWGDALEVVVAQDQGGTFSLAVYEAGELTEVHARLSPIPGGPGDAATAVAAASQRISVDSLAPVWPAMAPTRLRFSGGRDGTAALTAEDFTGAPGDLTPRGLGVLRDVENISIVAIPDATLRPVPAPPPAQPLPAPTPDPCLLDPPPPPVAPPSPPPPAESPPALSDGDSLTIALALAADCASRGDRFGLVDPPASVTTAVSSLVTFRDDLQDTSYAALYHPWVQVVDPLGIEGLVRAIPPSGHVAGVLARTDLASGVHTPPANAELEWAQGLTIDVDTGTQAILNPQGINCLRRLAGRGLRVYGERTLSSDPLLVYVNVRRLLIMIETAIDQATQWAVFEPADVYLRELIRTSISSFLRELWQAGALVGGTEADAYFVQCDDITNPPDQVALGELIAVVGVAPVSPAEFVVLRVARVEGALEVTVT